jgi:transposase
MMGLPSAVELYVCTTPVDLRKQHDGLCGLVRGALKKEPMSGHVFIFLNRRRDRIKILFWDRTGYCLVYKRLERGTFHLPREVTGGMELRIDAGELVLMLEGIELQKTRRRRRWIPGAKKVARTLALPSDKQRVAAA